jgi:hypothetical protein
MDGVIVVKELSSIPGEQAMALLTAPPVNADLYNQQAADSRYLDSNLGKESARSPSQE